METTNILKFSRDKCSVPIQGVICKIEHTAYVRKSKKKLI
jgi:hypothetical protein